MGTDTGGITLESLGQTRRSPMEMVCDILVILSKGPAKPTHILYKANMSWKVLTIYLEYLVRRGLVAREEDGGKRCTYGLTERGRSVLDLYENLRSRLDGTAATDFGDFGSMTFGAAGVAVPRAAPTTWF